MRALNASRRNRGRNNNIRRNGSGINKVFDGNGSENRVKGNPLQVHEKYQALARDAKSSGDSIKAENYLQHAEHFHRVHQSRNTFNSENGSLKENDDKQKHKISIGNENTNNNKKSAITNEHDKDVIEAKKLKDNPKKNIQSEQKKQVTD
tara:strand:+ start:124 stop:573 length:450 start_codon:yes stop_codon:yes gene_type:complete